MDYQKRKNEWSKYNENGYYCYRWHAIGCKCNLCVNPGTKIELIAKKVGMIMKKQVIGCSRFVKILGIITTVMFGLISLVTLISGYYIAAFCFLPFVFLGGALLVACKKQTIIIDDNALTFNYVLKHSIEVRYADIRCLLLIPLGNRKQMALIDRDYNRLVTLDYALGNLEILYEALALHEVKIVDFEELLDKKKDVSKYVRTFNAIERNYYRSIVEENKTIRSISSNKCGFDLNKSKKILRILGFVFIALDVIGFFIGGKMMMVLLVFVILGSYTVYLWYYPYIYIETKTKKGEDIMLQMPFLGAAFALLLNLATTNVFDYDFIDYLKITLTLTLVFSIPFIVKSLCTKLPQRFGRKLSVIFAVLVFSFTITFPVNFLLTFGKSEHETIVITDKDVDTGNSLTDYELIATWRGKEKEFNVSKSQYLKTNIGDSRRVCIRKSMLGLEYYSVHE